MNGLFPPLSEDAVTQIMAALECWHSIERQDEAIDKSIGLDATGVTTAMVLSANIESFADEFSASLREVLEANQGFLAAKNTVVSIRQILAHAEIQEALMTFRRNLAAAVSSELGEPTLARCLGTINSPVDAAYLRLSALHSLRHLRRDQFLAGEPAKGSFHFNTWVHEFINPNSMIAAVARQPLDGITLTLIRDPHIPEYSYFGFVLRYGGNVVFLTDRPEFDNPRQKFWRRRPGRDLSSRIEQSHFPYQLLDLEFDDRGDAMVRPPAGKTLVAYQETAHRLCRVADLEPEQIVWLALMFDLIQAEIVNQGWRCSELSYTGEMVARPDALACAGREIVLPAEYAPIALPPLAISDVTHEATRQLFERTPTGCRSWLEDYYGSQVDPAAVAVDLPSTQAPELPVNGAEIKPFETLDLTSYGTATELAKDRIWLARWNYTRDVLARAKEDFAARRDEVAAWYRGRLLANLSALADAVVKGEFLAHAAREAYTFGPLSFDVRNILKLASSTGPSFQSATHVSSGYSRQFDGFYCVDQPTRIATEMAEVTPSTPEAIAALCGCAVHDLPIPLQNWYALEPYLGNSILDDVDPMEAGHHANPWEAFPAVVKLHFSKFAARRWRNGEVGGAGDPTKEFTERFLAVLHQHGRLVDRKAGRFYRVCEAWHTEGDPALAVAKLNTRWKRSRYLSVADAWRCFDLVDPMESTQSSKF
jgi:hypothetical protein